MKSRFVIPFALALFLPQPVFSQRRDEREKNPPRAKPEPECCQAASFLKSPHGIGLSVRTGVGIAATILSSTKILTTMAGTCCTHWRLRPRSLHGHMTAHARVLRFLLAPSSA